MPSENVDDTEWPRLEDFARRTSANIKFQTVWRRGDGHGRGRDIIFAKLQTASDRVNHDLSCKLIFGSSLVRLHLRATVFK
jgi:hypothetical protein